MAGRWRPTTRNRRLCSASGTTPRRSSSLASEIATASPVPIAKCRSRSPGMSAGSGRGCSSSTTLTGRLSRRVAGVSPHRVAGPGGRRLSLRRNPRQSAGRQPAPGRHLALQARLLRRRQVRPEVRPTRVNMFQGAPLPHEIADRRGQEWVRRGPRRRPATSGTVTPLAERNQLLFHAGGRRGGGPVRHRRGFCRRIQEPGVSGHRSGRSRPAGPARSRAAASPSLSTLRRMPRPGR